jgi:hypothetical protein
MVSSKYFGIIFECFGTVFQEEGFHVIVIDEWRRPKVVPPPFIDGGTTQRVFLCRKDDVGTNSRTDSKNFMFYILFGFLEMKINLIIGATYLKYG